ncbi:hypothetical protein OBBRIDRAFT_794662 [Obba rivulosa]|uniref:Uncharacterized protein n=1 Tax=Obba rivulosa TaxID=1052685 RepID=A0A8E2ATI3_9APHY|nr:hypothetical protein OBBRIDRAFT_794662 [Obba rivulosa]
MDSSLLPSSSSTSLLPSASTTPDWRAADETAPARHANPVAAFIIGLAIVLLASILNAAGLNLTKLDHVRTMAVPKAARRKDWLRPLWLLGMVLYILSQLIGSTLALEYMRAEYVAPLGATSLIFNFLFAKFLVDSPVTNYDIYGTIVVILGVIGIVAFGSINSGLGEETNAKHLTYLWTRGNWLAFFFFMSAALILLSIFTSQLDRVLAARAELVPESELSPKLGSTMQVGYVRRAFAAWDNTMAWLRDKLEVWTATHDDKRIAWTLGIGWACCGGGLAGGCLVFAKAAVKLISGSLSHENTGNQFGHASSIFTFIFLAVTAVSQIICLNRGLKVYDSTLVVPVFYGVYTGVGWLDSLIFNDEVDAYQSWTLFLIFVSMIVLISGVVLLTYKKPAHTGVQGPGATHVPLSARGRRQRKGIPGTDEEEALRDLENGEGENDAEMWQLGDVSDDEEQQGPSRSPSARQKSDPRTAVDGEGERERMMRDDGEDLHRQSTSSDATLARPDEEFGAWEGKPPSR